VTWNKFHTEEKSDWVPPLHFTSFRVTSLHLTSLHLVEPVIPIGVEGLQSAFHLSQSRAMALIPFHLIPIFFEIFCIPSYQVVGFFFWASQPSVLACQAILFYLFSPILTICPNDLNCAHSIIPSRGICNRCHHIKCSRLGDLTLGFCAALILGASIMY
jgi:hypothetical protein